MGKWNRLPSCRSVRIAAASNNSRCWAKTSVTRLASGLSTKIGIRGSEPACVSSRQEVQHLLRTSQAECRDDHFAVAFVGPLDDFQEPRLEILRRRMNGVGVGRFGDQHVAAFDQLRIAEQG